MVTKKLRERLENFICEHEDCADEDCILKAVEAWVADLADRGYPHEEIVILALGYQAYVARESGQQAQAQAAPPKARALSLVR